MRKSNLLFFSIIILISTILTSCASLFGPPTVTFIVDGDIYSKYTLLEGGTTARMPEDPTKANNQFLGWYLDQNGKEKFNETETLYFSEKVYGIWKYYDVKFDDTLGNVEVIRQTSRERMVLPKAPTKSGMYFCGWMSSSTKEVLTENTIFTDVKDTNFYALWSNVKLEKRSDGNMYVAGVLNKKDTKIVIPPYYKGAKVVEIAPGCFKDNKSIREVVIPDTISKIGGYAFYECDNLQSLKIPEGIKSLQTHMAYGCDNLKEVTLPSTLIRLGDKLPEGEFDKNKYNINIFTRCGIEHINLPSGLLAIGHGSLAETQLREINIPSSVKYIEEYALRRNDNLKSITIPATVEKVGRHVLDECDNLETVYYNSNANIPEAAFEKDKNLKEIFINGEPKKISSWAFKNCDSLVTVTIPKSVELLEKQAFGFCDKLKTVNLLNDNPGFITRASGNPFEGCKMNAYIYESVLEDYKNDSYWKNGLNKGWVKVIQQ